MPRDIQEDLAPKKPAKVKPGEFDGDLAIADLGGTSIMEEEPGVKELLAAQMKPVRNDNDAEDEIPPATNGAHATYDSAQAKPPVPRAPTIPDFRGKSLRDVVEESSAEGLDLMIEGSGVARVQVPPPGAPLHRGERIRIVFTR